MSDFSDGDLKNKIESVLFSTGKRLSVQELGSLCKEPDVAKLKHALGLLKKELEEKKSSIALHEEGDYVKLGVRDQYLSIVRKVVKKTELTKSVLETLAVVAFKSPVLQSKVIAIRTNKAYDHLNNLEELGYITREKQGRTKLIKVAKKFFEYFDIPEDRLKERFGNASSIEQAIAKKELESSPQSPAIEPYGDVAAVAPSSEIIPQDTMAGLEVYAIEEGPTPNPLSHKLKEENSGFAKKEKNSHIPTPLPTTEATQPDSVPKKNTPPHKAFSETGSVSIEQKVDERVAKMIQGKDDSDDKDGDV